MLTNSFFHHNIIWFQITSIILAALISIIGTSALGDPLFQAIINWLDKLKLQNSKLKTRLKTLKFHTVDKSSEKLLSKIQNWLQAAAGIMFIIGIIFLIYSPGKFKFEGCMVFWGLALACIFIGLTTFFLWGFVVLLEVLLNFITLIIILTIYSLRILYRPAKLIANIGPIWLTRVVIIIMVLLLITLQLIVISIQK